MRRNGNKASLTVRNLEIYGVERKKYGFDRKDLCNILKIKVLKLTRSSDWTHELQNRGSSSFQ
jgi:hypothetical protein